MGRATDKGVITGGSGFTKSHIDPLVSIVIPTFNSSTVLQTCLKSVKSQTYRNIEVVVVDNYSTDNTKEIAEKYGAKVLLLKAARTEARNYGERNAKGEYLFFMDSDMELAPGVVEEGVNVILNKKADAVIVPEVSVGEGFWARCVFLEKLTYIRDQLIEAARFMKREAFEAVGGYDEELEAGEDWDLHTRIEKAGFQISRVNSMIMHHEGNLALKDILMKKYQYGKTITKYVKKHPEKASKQLMFLRLSYIRHWRMLLKDPFHGFGLILMKALEYAVALIGSIDLL